MLNKHYMNEMTQTSNLVATSKVFNQPSRNKTEKTTEVFNTQECDPKTMASHHLYRIIKSTVKHFDRHFDNTVVDTFAFDQVLHSEELNNVIYHFLNDTKYDLEDKIEGITTFVILEVKRLYQINHHTLFNPSVYFEYINQLIHRILSH